MTDLSQKHCVPCEGGVPKLTAEEVKMHLQKLRDWQANAENSLISKRYTFKDYYRTMAFINAVAWIAHNENHHPDITFGYNYCEVSYHTHAIGGLSENDFICAAKVDQLAYL
ncbi:MAG: pterin-4-alpha-carbinolamine dehydratase [Gammaproteobacteria bacterium]|jgi:4a-hydroxytetrahydrobiopterin dehydratase|nr:pterin-4-alpha-carbinolamine dehydratase [Gammaproteobacteria bacterium]